MNKKAIALSIAASLANISNISADTIEDRLLAMEKRLQQLEQKVVAQQETIREKDKQIAEISENSSSSSGGWFQKAEVGGVVEIEAQRAPRPGRQLL